MKLLRATSARWPFSHLAGRPSIRSSNGRGEPVHSSPIGLMIYPRYGLCHSYRGALGFREALDVPELVAAPSPCNSCRERWFLNACPVGAFSGSGYHVAACAGHLKTRPARIAWARDAGRGAPARSVQPMLMARARRISPCGRFWRARRPLTLPAGIDRGHDPDGGAEGNAVALGAIGQRLADFRRRRGANRFALAVVYAVRRLDRQRCRDDPVKSAVDGDVEIEILGLAPAGEGEAPAGLRPLRRLAKDRDRRRT